MLSTEAGKVTGMSARRQLESTPTDPYPVPKTSGIYVVNRAVINGMICNTLAIQGSNLRTRRGNLLLALPIAGTKVIHALHYGE